MFGRSTRKRRKLEEDDDPIDYKAKVYTLLRNPEMLESDSQRKILGNFRRLIISYGESINENTYKRIYQCIYAGDPKQRTQRAIKENIIRQLKMPAQEKRRSGEL